ncbi:MAG TPA: pitrilysin family protein [Burkholderiales bacterium]|nr:pitrilysin family protein [Burkholderiales bacterium]
MKFTNLAKFVVAVALCAAGPVWAMPAIQQWHTANGARVLFVQNKDLPILDVSIDFPAGSSHDTAETSGLANLTQHMLRLGAGGMSEDDISRKLADIGAELSSRFGRDQAGLALRTLADAPTRKQALDVFTRVLTQPEFPEAVFKRERGRLIAALEDADTRPGTIASHTFVRLIYPDHPYGLRGAGEPATLRTLTRDDLVNFYRQHYNAKHAVVAIVGDVTLDDAQAIAERVTRDLPVASTQASVIPPVPDLAAAETRMIPHPASQAHILIGCPGIARSDPDYFPLLVGNFVLGGGGFVSRLTDEVRDKRGLAYSVYSYFEPLQRRGPFVIGMQTRKNQVKEALTVVRDTLRKFITDGPTAAEVKAAQDNLIGGFPLRIDSNRKILEYLSVIGFYDLPLTYLDDFREHVKAVSIPDIKRAFARHVDPDKLVTVVVGAAPDAGKSPSQK